MGNHVARERVVAMNLIRRKIGSAGKGYFLPTEGYLVGLFGICRVPFASQWWVIHQGTGAAVVKVPRLRDAKRFANALMTIPGNPWVSKSWRKLCKDHALKQAVRDKMNECGLVVGI